MIRSGRRAGFAALFAAVSAVVLLVWNMTVPIAQATEHRLHWFDEYGNEFCEQEECQPSTASGCCGDPPPLGCGPQGC